MEVCALITAANNEEEHIERTLRSVTSQTVLPGKWIIVSDGSIDRTDELVLRFAETFPFIKFARLEKNRHRNFASKVHALNAGIRMLELEEFEFVGFLDADVSFAPSCFHDLFEKFRQDPALGLAGGFIYEKANGQFISASGNRTWSVAGALQMFRRECYEDVGGLLPLEYGDTDTYAEVVARMKGWRVRSFPELEVHHHRPTGDAIGKLRYLYRQGFADYSIGYHPVFEAARMVRRVPYRPFLLGALAQVSGFLAAGLCRHKRIVTPEFVTFLRKEQRERLRVFGCPLDNQQLQR